MRNVVIWVSLYPLNHFLIFLSQSCLRSTQPRQKTKQVKANNDYNWSCAKHFQGNLVLTTQPVALFHLQPCVKTARSSRYVNTAALEPTTVHALQDTMGTSVKVLYTRPAWGLLAGSWAGSKQQTRVFEEELCYPTGIWSAALEEAAVMMDYCNYQNWHGLAQFTTGNLGTPVAWCCE